MINYIVSDWADMISINLESWVKVPELKSIKLDSKHFLLVLGRLLP